MEEFDTYAEAVAYHAENGGYLIRSGHAGKFMVVDYIVDFRDYLEGSPLFHFTEDNWAGCGWDQIKSEALMMAAAPELFDALMALRNDCEAILEGDDMSGMSDRELFGAFLGVIDPAIAKAKGEEQ